MREGKEEGEVRGRGGKRGKRKEGGREGERERETTGKLKDEIKTAIVECSLLLLVLGFPFVVVFPVFPLLLSSLVIICGICPCSKDKHHCI